MAYNSKPTLIIKKRPNPLDSLFKDPVATDDEKRTRFVGISISPKLYKELKKCSVEQTRSVSSTVATAIKFYIKHFNKGEN